MNKINWVISSTGILVLSCDKRTIVQLSTIWESLVLLEIKRKYLLRDNMRHFKHRQHCKPLTEILRVDLEILLTWNTRFMLSSQIHDYFVNLLNTIFIKYSLRIIQNFELSKINLDKYVRAALLFEQIIKKMFIKIYISCIYK